MRTRTIRWYDYVTVNIFWFALAIRGQVLTPLIVPLMVQQFVGENAKGTYVGTIRLWALMAAVLVQALMGLLSDHSTSKWGRRRPFIFAGTVSEALVIVLIGFTMNMTGMHGYWMLFSLYISSMVFSNTAQAGTQGLIPDLVPEDKRGRFSAIKALLELPIPLIFISLVIGKLIGTGNLWGPLALVVAVLISCMAITMFAPEMAQKDTPFALAWRPFLRLILMSCAFTGVIICTGEIVKLLVRTTTVLTGNLGTAVVALVGLGGMIIAVAVGVWASIRIGIGKEIKRNPSFTWWVINRLVFLAAGTNLAVFMIFFFQTRFTQFGGEKAAVPATRAIMFVGIFVLLATIPAGWLADRFRKKHLLAASGVLAALGVFLVVILPELTVIYIGACLIGAAVGIFYTSNWALGTEIIPREQAGQYLGLSNLAGAGAGAIGVYIGGPVADAAGYVMLFAIYGIFFLLSIGALWGITEPNE